MFTTTEWSEALADAASELLEKSHLLAPPVDAIGIARSLGMQVAWDHGQSGRGRIKRIAGKSIIFLRPDDRPERLHWAAAHELGESLVWQVCRGLGIDGNDLSPRQREDLANQLAKEILLPRAWFASDCTRFGYDLFQIKARYATASHELIACRWLDRESPGIVTLFDQGQLTRRQGNGPLWPPALTAIERRCWEQLRRTRQPVRQIQDGWLMRGWCVDTPDWQREILYAELPGSFDEPGWHNDGE